ncbi:DoxX family protein [Streptomyces sp. HNM0574]|uniref:DoxX family protein n=1 Tax=Streptomyces sp. HNM0574 TaxID=2714954 RepID=UPI00321725FB
MLSTVKVPSDPAQVVVNHASFRVQLGAPSARTAGAASAGSARTAPPSAARVRATADTGQTAVAGAGARAAGAPRRAPVVWTGRTEPGDSGATALLQAAAARQAETHDGAEPGGVTTQVLPRVTEDTGTGGPGTGRPTVVGPRGPKPPETVGPEPLLRGVRPAEGAFDEPEPAEGQRTSGGTAAGEAARRQAYYPGHRMNLGVVLLPLRIFLGLISVYAGMGKLCDPVYFDGGERGSMVTWLRKLEPWTIASPLRDFALEHPVGAGLTVAFLQVIVGVLTIFGIWQRLAAGFGALLSAALLMTVSWSTVPAYDAPDIIYLAAWSPLIIAGAPVYSVDARLATDAWRKLGPRVDIWDLRRRVLRRGAVVATVVVGLALLIGSLLGGAVRASQQAPVPEPGEQPVNQLPGSPLPKKPGEQGGANRPSQTPGGAAGGSPSLPPSTPPQQQRESSGPSAPSDEQTVQAPQQTPTEQQPQQTPGGTATSGPQDGAGGATGDSGSGEQESSPDSGSGSDGGSSSGSDGGGGLGGLLG